MPLHITWECCKCKSKGSQSLWSISRNHKYYSDRRYVCKHFYVRIDTVSSTGFFGIGWKNEITLEADYNGWTKTVIHGIFNKNHMEEQSVAQFGNLVFHARVSDYKEKYPTCGYNLQNKIEYNERMEQQRREQEEKKRKYQNDIKLKLDRLFQEEMEEKKEEEEKKRRRKEKRK